MKKISVGIITFFLIVLCGNTGLAGDPIPPPKKGNIIPVEKPLLSPKEVNKIKNQSDKGIKVTPTLPKNTGIISGIIEVFNVSTRGCTSVTFKINDNGRIVPATNLFLFAVSTGNPYSTGHGYEIKNLRPGLHVISMQTIDGCAKYRWFPREHRVNLSVTNHMKAERKNFVYKHTKPRPGR